MVRTASRVLVASSVVAALLVIVPGPASQALGGGSGSVSLTSLGSPYTQDFDTLANTGTMNNLPINGWFLDEAGTSGSNNGQYAAGTGSGNAGDVYSFGATASAERALGTLRSGTLTPTIGAQFTNNTGTPVTALDVAFTGEMWRAGVTNRNAADRLDFQLSTDATSLSTGTWVDYDALDLHSPNLNATAGALNGNSAPNQAPVSLSITGLNIANGASLWVRWSDVDISGSDDALAVDTFSLTPRAGDVAPGVVDTFPDNGATDFPVNSNLTVTFSEPVNVTPSWFTLVCSASGEVTTTSSGGPTSYTLDPGTTLQNGETCTLTVLADQVSDQDGNDPPDTMVLNFVVGFTAFDVCQSPYTPIPTIQGSGLSTPIPGALTTQGVVVGDFEGSTGQAGFYLQDLTGDADSGTSTGSSCSPAVRTW